jgi:hypothetical protein
MPELLTFAGPTLDVMLVLCVLSVGFMLRVLLAFVVESRKEPAKHLVSVAPATGRTNRVSEQVFDGVPIAFAVRYSAQLTWRQANADSIRSRTV